MRKIIVDTKLENDKYLVKSSLISKLSALKKEKTEWVKANEKILNSKDLNQNFGYMKALDQIFTMIKDTKCANIEEIVKVYNSNE